MKVIHAVWEKRNLGIDCYEVELEAQDSFNEFKDWEASACGEYMVVKVPVERDDIFLKMPSLGYTFIEMATGLLLIHVFPLKWQTIGILVGSRMR